MKLVFQNLLNWSVFKIESSWYGLCVYATDCNYPLVTSIFGNRKQGTVGVACLLSNKHLVDFSLHV